MTRRKNNKKALSLSLLSLLLCMAMLVGSTFAWFTDNATTSVNTIQSGTLEIDLIDKDGKSVVGSSLAFEKGGDNILWEPGSTWNLQEVRVVNKGNLALKYMIEITGIQGAAKLNEVIVWTIDYGYGENATEGHLAAGATSAPIVISGHMKEEAGNEYQNLKIEGITITVRATQDTVEYDSSNNTYDANAAYDMATPAPSVPDEGGEGGGESGEDTPDYPFDLDKEKKEIIVYNASDFAMLAEGAEAFGLGVNDYPDQYTVKLGKSINYGGGTLSNPIEAWWNKLDGQGNTITNVKVNTTETWAGLFKPGAAENTLNIKNLKLDNITVTTSAANAFAGAVVGYSANAHLEDITVTNATVNGTKYSGGIIGQAGSTHVIGCSVSNTTITGTRVGGIVGDAFNEGGTASVKNCTADNVTLINLDAANGSSDGIAGRLRNGIVAENCTASNVTRISNVVKNDDMTSDSVQNALNAGGTVDFGGSTIEQKTGTAYALYYPKLSDGSTIKNLNVEGSMYGVEMHGDVTFENCSFVGQYAPNISDGTNAVPGKATFINCTFQGWLSFAADKVTSAEFINCKFIAGEHTLFMNNYQDTTFTDCTFDSSFGIDDELAGAQTWTFTNCTGLNQAKINATGTYQTVTIVQN